MQVIIGVDPHKGSHTAVAISAGEDELDHKKVRACRNQVDQLLAWAEPFPARTWAIEGADGMGHLLAQQLVATGEHVVNVPATSFDTRALGQLAGTALSVVAYRNQAQGFDPRGGDGAGRLGGRYNPPHSFPVLYLCVTRPCVAAELTRQAERQNLRGRLPMKLGRSLRRHLLRQREASRPRIWSRGRWQRSARRPFGQGGPMRVTGIHANLPVADIAAASDFYTDYLGLSREEFNMGWVARYSSPRGEASVQLVTHDATAPQDSVISVHVGAGVDEAYAEAQRRGYEIVHPLTEEAWGLRRFFVRAPDGNVINMVSHSDDQRRTSRTGSRGGEAPARGA